MHKFHLCLWVVWEVISLCHWIVFYCMAIPQFIHWCTERHFGCFQHLSVMANAAITFQVSGVKTEKHNCWVVWKVCVWLCKKLPHSPPKWLPFSIPTSKEWKFLSLYTISNWYHQFVSVVLLYSSHLIGVWYHFLFKSIIFHDKWCWLFFPTFIWHRQIFSVRSVQTFGPYFNSIVISLLLVLFNFHLLLSNTFFNDGHLYI